MQTQLTVDNVTQWYNLGMTPLEQFRSRDVAVETWLPENLRLNAQAFGTLWLMCRAPFMKTIHYARQVHVFRFAISNELPPCRFHQSVAPSVSFCSARQVWERRQHYCKRCILDSATTASSFQCRMVWRFWLKEDVFSYTKPFSSTFLHGAAADDGVEEGTISRGARAERVH